jgi:hypothetical protein
MKILITEGQLRDIISEARGVIDTRGKLGDKFQITSSGNYYVIMSNMGNMLMIDEVDYIKIGDNTIHDIEKSDVSDLESVYNIGKYINGELYDKIPDEFKSGGKISMNHNDNISAVLYVNVKKKTIQNVTGYEYVKDGYKDYKYKTSEYYNPTMVKKVIKDLLSIGYIDGKYKYIDVNQEDSTDNPTEYNEKEQYLYHGTTKSNGDRILKIGLRPKDTEDGKTLFRGNSSTLVGYTDKNVYLSPSLDVAKQYAYRQSKYNNDEPVVLKIQIPDISNLVLDDDNIIKKIGKVIYEELNKRIVVGEKNKFGYPEFYKTDWTGNEPISKNLITYVNLLWRSNFSSLIENGEFGTYTDLLQDSYIRMRPEELSEFRNKLPDSFYVWLKDLVIGEYNGIKNEYYRKHLYNSSTHSIAYKGSIPPKFIQIIPVTYKLKKDN